MLVEEATALLPVDGTTKADDWAVTAATMSAEMIFMVVIIKARTSKDGKVKDVRNRKRSDFVCLLALRC